MTSFLHCALYLAATGIGAFFLGRLLPKTWFRGDAFPYRCYPSEQKLFRVLHIKDWQSRVPDMSRILPGLMPAKKLTAETFSDLPRMNDPRAAVADRTGVSGHLAGDRRRPCDCRLYSVGQPALYSHSAVQPSASAKAFGFTAQKTGKEMPRCTH